MKNRNERSTRALAGVKPLIMLVSVAMLLSACASGRSDDYGRLFPKTQVDDSEAKTLFGSYLAGRQAAIERDSGAAAIYYKRALESEPNNNIILERAFLLEVSAGNYQEALKLAETLVVTRPTNRLARMVLALNAIEKSNYETARVHLGESASGLYNIVAADVITAWTYAGEGDLDSAENALVNIGILGRDSILQAYHLALVHDYLGQDETAEQHYQNAMEISSGANLRVVEAYGRFLERSKRSDEAMVIYAEFLAFAPNNPSITAAMESALSGKKPAPMIASAQRGAAEAVFGVASLLSYEQNADLPIVYLRLALILAPDHAESLLLLGDIYQRTGRFEAAARAFAAIPKDHPLAISARIQIAANLERLDRDKEARQVLEYLLDQHPDDIDIMIALGDMYRIQESYNSAAKMYDRALATNDERLVNNWLLYYSRGAAFERLGQWPKAEKDLRHALSLAPDQPLVLNYLGYGWIDQGKNLGEALNLIQRAVELSPNSGFIIDSLGWAYFKIGEYERAIKYLERAVELEPDDPTVNDHLGDAYWMAGRSLEARFQWSHALDRNPEAKQVKVIEKKLDEGLSSHRNGTG